jgi:ArsR family transcriptional regulator
MFVAVLSALAEPTRLAAMLLLADGSEHGVCELTGKPGVAECRSRHVQALKQAAIGEVVA